MSADPIVLHGDEDAAERRRRVELAFAAASPSRLHLVEAERIEYARRSRAGSHLAARGEPVEIDLGALPEGVQAGSDLASAHLLREHAGRDLRFAREFGRLTWDGRRWAPDTTGEAERRMHTVGCGLELRAADLLAVAASAESEREAEELRAQAQLFVKWARAAQSEPGIRRAVTIAETLLPIDAALLDTDPWAWNASNGTVDLRTGDLRPHSREDLITKLAPVAYDPAAEAPTFDRFLAEVLPDADVRGFVQRYLGYALTGSTAEQVFVVAIGGGSNGKSTLAELVRDMLGEYACDAPTDTIMHVHGRRGAENDVARLRGARFVTAKESGEGQRIDEPRIKQLTGGDTVTARFLFREHFEFRPQFKLWLYANHRPHVRGGDDAIWRRLALVPFDVQIPAERRDSELPAKLRAELPGVLAWAVRGCLDWQRGGLRMPAAVQARTDAWRAENDDVRRFIDESCVVRPGLRAEAGTLFGAFREWCSAQGVEAVSQTSFGTRLDGLGFHGDRTGRKRFRVGLGLEASGRGDES